MITPRERAVMQVAFPKPLGTAHASAWAFVVYRIAVVALISSVLVAPAVSAQTLVPGAYTPGPIGFNVVTVLATFNKGDVTFDPSLPIEEARAAISATGLGYARTFSLAGRYANAGLAVTYAHGNIEGLVLGELQQRTRSGPGDISARIAVNLYGAPALTRQAFAGYQSRTIVGLSLSATMPVGQYDPAHAINIGTNRWSFAPEVGISRRSGRWTLEGDIGAVLFTDNTNYVNGGTREQAPIATLQAHLIHTIRPGFWVAADGNFWRGGRVTTNGTPAVEQQHNSRLGVTVAVPIRRHQVRIAFSTGAYVRLGGDFISLGVSYSYAWTAR